MNTTTTITSQIQTLHLGLKLKPTEKIKTLVLNLKEGSKNLPGNHPQEVLKWLTEWEELFFQKQQPESPLEEVRLKAVRALCFLDYYKIAPIMTSNANTRQTQVAWFHFQKELHQIINEILPSKYPLKPFLKKYREAVEKTASKKILAALCIKVQNVAQEVELQLYNIGNKCNEKLIELLEEAKRQLLEAETENEFHEVHQSLTLLSSQVTQLVQDTQGHLGNAEKLAEQMQTQANALENNLNNTQKLIN